MHEAPAMGETGEGLDVVRCTQSYPHNAETVSAAQTPDHRVTLEQPHRCAEANVSFLRIQSKPFMHNKNTVICLIGQVFFFFDKLIGQVYVH